MELIQLKIPPDKLRALVSIVEDSIDHTPSGEDITEAVEIRDWLRYRLSLWTQRKRANSDV